MNEDASTIAALTRRIQELEAQLAAQQDETDLWRARIDAMLSISEETSDALYTDQIFETIADTVLAITQFDAMGLSLYEPEQRGFRYVALQGLPDSFQLGVLKPARNDGFHDTVLRTLEPVFTSDFASDPRASIHEQRLEEAGLHSLAFIPVLANGQLMGIIGLQARETVDWTLGQQRWLSFIGRQIGILLHHAQLADQMCVTAGLEERVRLGRELHDHLAQVLGYLNLKSQLAETFLTSEANGSDANGSDASGQALAEVVEIKEVSSQTYDELRDSILALRTMHSLDEDLISTLRTYAVEFSRRSGLETTVDDSGWGNPALSPEKTFQVLRILQEALTNVRRHANANNVRIVFTSDDSAATYQVVDDGIGFELSSADPQDGRSHLGLLTMAERALSVGATLTIDSRPGAGTGVIVTLPLPQPGKIE